MAGHAIIHDATVTEIDGNECRGVVARIALIRGRNMVERLALRIGNQGTDFLAPMACTATGGENLIVIHGVHRHPHDGAMASLTVIGGRRMVARLTGSDPVVVTVYAGTDGFLVSDGTRRLPFGNGVAGVTYI